MERHPVLWVRKFNILKMSLLPKTNYRWSAIPVKIPMAFYAEIS